MSATRNEIIFFVLLFCFVLYFELGKENFINYGYNSKPPGYFNVIYTGYLSVLLSDTTVAWIKDPTVTQDIVFDDIFKLRDFIMSKIAPPSNPNEKMLSSSEQIDKKKIQPPNYDTSWDFIMLVDRMGRRRPNEARVSQNPSIMKNSIDGPILTKEEYLKLWEDSSNGPIISQEEARKQ